MNAYRCAPLAIALLAVGCAREPATAPSTDTPTPGPAAQAPPAAPEYRLPGPFRADLTVARMRALFGDAQVRIGLLPSGEGDSERGVTLFPDDPGRRLVVYFEDPDRLTRLAAVSVEEPESRWQLDPGVRVGMTAEALVALNEAPISYAGYDWDGSGYVLDWHGGRLASGPHEPQRVVILDVPPGDDSAIAMPLGEGSFRSDDERYREAFRLARVREIGLRWLAGSADAGDGTEAGGGAEDAANDAGATDAAR